jgi:hypothetical protein
MSQSWNLPPAGTDYANVVLKTTFPDAMETLRTLNSGASAPASTVAYMLWADTTAGYLKIRNAANTAWVRVAPLATESTYTMASDVVASMSATTTFRCGAALRAGTLRRVLIVGETATTSTVANEWRFQVTRYPASAPGSPVTGFSANVGTYTALAGVGGGAELVAFAAYSLTPNQNTTVAELDVYTVTATAVGTPTTVANVRAIVEAY